MVEVGLIALIFLNRGHFQPIPSSAQPQNSIQLPNRNRHLQPDDKYQARVTRALKWENKQFFLNGGRFRVFHSLCFEVLAASSLSGTLFQLVSVKAETGPPGAYFRVGKQIYVFRRRRGKGVRRKDMYEPVDLERDELKRRMFPS